MWNWRRNGSRGVTSLPHRQFWLQLYGLVRDGMEFRRGGGRQQRDRGGGSNISEGKATLLSHAERGAKNDDDRGDSSSRSGSSSKPAKRPKEKKAKSGRKSSGREQGEDLPKAESVAAPAEAPTAVAMNTVVARAQVADAGCICLPEYIPIVLSQLRSCLGSGI